MPNYKYPTTATAMDKIRDTIAMVPVMASEIERIKSRYAPAIAEEKISGLCNQYRDACRSAHASVKEAISAAHERVEEKRSAMLHLGNAEEDFKLLALPVTLSRNELRVMLKRNEGNEMFARAVGQYAQEHNYDEPDFRALGTDEFEMQHQNIDDAGRQLLHYCEDDRLGAAIANDWRGLAFNTVEALGLFDDL